jgi:hypothetical protein
MLAGVAPALFLRSLIDLAARAVYNSPRSRYEDIQGLSWADNYLYVMMTIVIFLLVAWIGCRKPRDLSIAWAPQKTSNGNVPVEYSQNGPPIAYAAMQPVYVNGVHAAQGNGQPTYNYYGASAAQQGPYRPSPT